MLKPICVPCQRFYRPKTNGYAFLEGMPIGDDVKPGKEDADRWHPYKLWSGDLWECKGCGHQTIRSAREPIAIRHEPDFNIQAVRLGAEYQVNDC